jgi:hydrogenase maturation protein HypF
VSFVERRRYRVRGVVQGVGFRPFVYGLAVRHRLAGFVLNDGEGVLIEAEGDEAALEAFGGALATEAPPLARVSALTVERLRASGESSFRIRPSRTGAPLTLVPPDVATCHDCVRELFDPATAATAMRS